MICPIHEENERLKKTIEDMKIKHSEDIEKIREMLANKIKEKNG